MYPDFKNILIYFHKNSAENHIIFSFSYNVQMYLREAIYMSAKTKIVVVKMRHIIFSGILLGAAILILILFLTMALLSCPQQHRR